MILSCSWSDTSTFDVNKRISKDGKYLGAAVGYNIEKEQAKLELRYTY
jgi:hypothetical protein